MSVPWFRTKWKGVPKGLTPFTPGAMIAGGRNFPLTTGKLSKPPAKEILDYTYIVYEN